MELLYNPREMTESDFRATFVARQPLVDEILDTVASQPDGAGVQHIILVAPRGLGKTTVLRMVEFGLRDRGLDREWQPVAFPEESYAIDDLAEFWLQVIRVLAATTADPRLDDQADRLRDEYPGNPDLQKAAVALLKDWRREHGRRLLLLVDNFDLILRRIDSEDDNASLRSVLMNDGTFMLIGGATTFFGEAQAYDQPLYHFFKRYEPGPLEYPQIEEMLRRRAELDGLEDFEQTLGASRSHLQALEYFTGGIPRLVLMLYGVLTQSGIAEVRRGLSKLLDEVTPYYKARVENLPPQQYKILQTIATRTAKTREGLTPGAIASATRLKPNQVSSQLKRLVEGGFVRAAAAAGRHSYYTLSEPLFALWHQMRFGLEARQRMQWLVDFVQLYYNRPGLNSESQRLNARSHELLEAGDLLHAGGAIEHRRYIVEAMGDRSSNRRDWNSLAESYIALTLTALLQGDLDTALGESDKAVAEDPKFAMGWYVRGMVLSFHREADALESLDEALRHDPDPDLRRSILCLKLNLHIRSKNLSAVSQVWDSLVEAVRPVPDRVENETQVLLAAARLGHHRLARNLIANTPWKDRLFPLDRALEYLETRDEALIDKLSPEVKKIVETIVKDLDSPVTE